MKKCTVCEKRKMKLSNGVCQSCEQRIEERRLRREIEERERIEKQRREEEEIKHELLSRLLREIETNRVSVVNINMPVYSQVNLKRTLEGHTKWINALTALSGGTLASISEDCTIKIWQNSKYIQMPERAIYLSLTVLPDDKLVSGDIGGGIKLWQEGKCVQTLNNAASSGAGFSIYALTVFPDGTLASGGEDCNTIKLWQDGRCVQTLEGHTNPIHALAVLPDGTLASGSLDKTIKLWQDGRCVQTLEGHTNTVLALAVLPDGTLASGSLDKTIKLWQNGRCVRTLEGHSDQVLALAVLPDGTLISGSADCTIKLWQDGRCIRTLKKHTKYVRALAVLPDCTFASGSSDNTIKIWEPLIINIKEEEINVVLESLRSNHSVNYLNLFGQTLSNQNIRKLVELLMTNHTISRVNLSNTGLNNDNAQVLLDAFKRNSNIINLSISGNKIAASLSSEIQLCIQKNIEQTRREQEQREIEEKERIERQKREEEASLRKEEEQRRKEQQGQEEQKRKEQQQAKDSKEIERLKQELEEQKRLLQVQKEQKERRKREQEEQRLREELRKQQEQEQRERKEKEHKQREREATARQQHHQEKADTERKRTASSVQTIPQEQIKFKETDKLGEGGFGVVYKGTYQYGEVAIKQLKMTAMSAEVIDEFQKEAVIMSELRHPNIISFFGLSVDPTGKYSMVMEFMPSGSLYGVLHNRQPLEWNTRYRIAGDVIGGLALLHSRNIMHRDLKSMNVLLYSQGVRIRAKLTDFGLSKVKSETASVTSTGAGQSVGTLPWMAPELFQRRAVYTKKSDIYSYGMILWELASRLVPFADASTPALIIKWVTDGEREDIPRDCPQSFAKLIRWCWNQKPEERPTIDEAAKEIGEILSTQPAEIDSGRVEDGHDRLDDGTTGESGATPSYRDTSVVVPSYRYDV